MSKTQERPKLFTLRAMASRLSVPADWLREQAGLGTVPAVQIDSTGEYLFSLDPTMRAIGKMAESRAGGDDDAR